MRKRISKRSLYLYAALQMYGFKKSDDYYKNNVYKLKVRDSLFSPTIKIHQRKARYSMYSLFNNHDIPTTQISDTSLEDIIKHFETYFS